MARTVSYIPQPEQVALASTILSRVRSDLLKIDPDIAEDETLLLDMLDGEGGDALDIIKAAVRSILEAEAFAEGITARINALSARRKRFADKAEVLRAGVLEAIEAAGIAKLNEPDFSISIRAGSKRVEVGEDLSGIPEAFLKRSVCADKSLLRIALDGGAKIDGAWLTYGHDTLSIRTK